ncbi:MAG: PAS domain-containing protein [Fulvivirga sp.]
MYPLFDLLFANFYGISHFTAYDMRTALFCLLFFVIHNSKAQQITVGVFENEPLMMVRADGTFDGLCVEVLRNIALKHDLTLEFKKCSAKQCHEWLDEGVIDIIAETGDSWENKSKYILADEGIVATWAAVYSNRDVDFNTLLDFNRKKIAVIDGSYFINGPRQGLKKIMSDIDVSCELVTVESYDEIFRLIEDGEVDAGVINRIYGDLNAQRFDVVRTAVVFSPFKLGFGYSPKWSEADKYKQLFDNELRRQKASQDSFYYDALGKYMAPKEAYLIPPEVWVVLGLLLLGFVQLILYVFLLRKQVLKRTTGLKDALTEIQEQKKMLDLIYNNTTDIIGLMQVVDQDTYVVKKLPDRVMGRILENYPQLHAYQIMNMEISKFHRDIIKFSEEEAALRDTYIKMAINSKKPVYFEEKLSLPIGVEGIAESAMIPICSKDEVTHIMFVSRDVTKEREMIEELRKNEEKMRLAVQTVPVMLDAFDEHGRIVVWNNKCEEVTGYSSEEIIGNPKAFEWLYPDEDYRNSLRSSWKESKNYEDETVITCKDGSKRTISWLHKASTNPIPGWHDWGIGIDITDRRVAESALVRSQQQLKSMMANLPGMAWRLNVDKDFTMIFVSDGVQELLNMSPEEFLSKGYKPSDFIMKEYHELVRAETFKSVESMTPSELVIPLEVDGQIKWVLDRFKPVKLSNGQIVIDGLLMDISDKLESEQRLQMAIEGAREGMWDWDIETNELKLNEYAIEMLGFNNKSIDNAFDRFFETLHPDDVEETKKALDNHLSGFTTYYEKEYRLGTKDGGWKWIQTRGRVVQRRSDGTPLRAIGTHIDINDRKVAEFALRDQEQLLSSMMSNLPGMAYRLDPDQDFEVIFVSEGSQSLFEISKEDFMLQGITLWDCTLPNYHDLVRSNYTSKVSYSSGGEHTIAVKTVSGGVKWVLDRFRVVEIDGKIVLDGILIDVTDKLESEKRLQLAIEGARQGTWDWNVETDDLSYNDYMARMLGYEPNEMQTKSKFFYDLLHPDDKKISVRKLKQYLRGESELFEEEYRIKTKSGKYKWIMTRGQVVTRNSKRRATRAIGVHIDIDDRKRAELALMENERMLSGLMSNLPGMVYKCENDPEWPIVFASEGILELAGYSARELESGEVKFADLSLDTNKEESYRRIQQAIRENRSYTLVYRIKTKHGEIKWVWEQGSSIPGTNLLEGFITDITDRVESEERIVGTIIDTEDNERKRISKELHDGLGQKLTTAALNLNALKRDISKEHKGFNKLINSLNSLNAAIRESRDIAHNLMPRSIDNFGYVPSVESMLADINSVSEIDFSFYQNLNRQRFDKKLEVHLYRITQEAVNNILKYSQATKVVIQLMKYDNELILTIEDDGIGFNKEAVFARGDNFGLRSMKTRTSSLSGDFNMDTAPNRGTIITVEIPLKLLVS